MAEMASEEPELVKSIEECERIASLLKDEAILALDCQGVYRGSHLRLTLLQIGTSKGKVYLFDVQENKNLLLNDGLRHLLESKDIEKVMFKCSKDSGALYHNFQITLQNVFDIQDAHIILKEQTGRKLFPSLNLRNVCRVYSPIDKVSQHEEDSMKKCAVESSDYWETLTAEKMSVAAGHVKALIPEVYREQKERIENFGLNQKFKERVLESVKLHIDRTVYTQRKDRINGHVMEILQSLENKCTKNTKLQDFEKDSEERLALQIVDVEIAQKMSEIIQQLKKEYIDSNLDEILEEVESDEAELLVTSSKLRFLNKTRGHPHKLFARKAGRIREKIQKIVLSSIERKYDVGTDVSLLSTCEQEILRDLPIWSDDDTNFPKVIKGLFWRLLDNDLARKSGALHKHKGNYRLNKHFYDRMQKFARGPSSVQIPMRVREKVKQFLDDISFYEIDTKF